MTSIHPMLDIDDETPERERPMTNPITQAKERIMRECTDKIIPLTGFGQTLHPNDIKPDIRDALDDLLAVVREEVKNVTSIGHYGNRAGDGAQKHLIIREDVLTALTTHEPDHE